MYLYMYIFHYIQEKYTSECEITRNILMSEFVFIQSLVTVCDSTPSMSIFKNILFIIII